MKWPGMEVGGSRTGRGLIASRSFRRGASIARITGRRVSADDVWDIGGRFADNCFRFGPETYLDPEDGPGRWLNHSCRPNAAITKRAHRLVLVAASAISAGDEVVIDYSTILGGDDIWTMRCRCGSRECRRVIRNIDRLPSALALQYLRRDMVPKFIRQTSRLGSESGL